MNYYNERPLFRGTNSIDYFEGCKKSILRQIESEEDNYILNVNETDYINHLVEKFRIAKIELMKEKLYQGPPVEEFIPAEQHPNHIQFTHLLTSGESYKRTVFVFKLPFDGGAHLLSVKPSACSYSSPRGDVRDNEICIRIVDFENNSAKIKSEVNHFVDNVIRHVDWLNNEIDQYNKELFAHIQNGFKQRKQKILDKYLMIEEIGVPIRKAANVPETFAIGHKTKKKVEIIKPIVTGSTFSPEPTLAESVYDMILKVLFDTGRKLEQMPSTYQNKDEEALRDLFLLPLESNVEGEATGETFNKGGKTDIIIKYQGKSLFVGELKFWRGKKKYLEGISQLLSYLTWRDSKAAMVVMVDSKEVIKVLQEIESNTRTHENFLGFVKKEEEGWIKYRFHLPGDRNREVKLAVLVFHYPRDH